MILQSRGQETYPVNGAYDVRPEAFAFVNATIVVSPTQTLQNGTLLIKDRHIVSAGENLSAPKGYVVIDLKGKFIYPSLIDAFTTYGMPEEPQRLSGSPRSRAQIFISTKTGAYSWNEAIRPENSAKAVFKVDPAKAEELKKNGFGIVQTLIRDGIARGTSMAVSLGNEKENEMVIKDETGAQYSFNKGSSSTNYPSSLMGSIALLRQTYYDAQWYQTQNKEYNISLAEFNRVQPFPQIFEVNGTWNILRADKIGDEFGKQYIFKTDGKEYQRLDAVKATNGSFIIPLTFPKPYDVEDQYEARNISYSQMKDWELAPANAAALEKAGIKFAITSFGLENASDFWPNLRKAIESGLSEKQALRSLTEIPAEMLGISGLTGSLQKGKLANFIITSDSLFKKDNIIYENWVEGKRYVTSKIDITDLTGIYSLSIDRVPAMTLTIRGKSGPYEASVKTGLPDTASIKTAFSRAGDLITIYFNTKKNEGYFRLTGVIKNTNPLTFNGEATLGDGSKGTWTAVFKEPVDDKATTKRTDNKENTPPGPVIFPFTAYGYVKAPQQETVLFRNATVWTNEKEGRLQNTDVLIEKGKIKAIGKNLQAGNARVIDATGKHLTPGIIDEHSHIAITGGVNEGTQAVTAEVRIGDVIDPEDIDIYRQLAGGVTTSQLLHGSANPIGGQAALIKHRWGKTAEEMKFEGSDGFIKFALGENVKQSNWNVIPGPQGLRFPQSRMGVEQVYMDAFTRAQEYRAARAKKGNHVRRDLELDALVEILDNKRFITCHSYVQSEINMLMHVADSMGFKINTFTHILEGYKVADKMQKRNIAGSTFADWWAYKSEVAEAIPYNGKIMHDVGVLTAFNSDDAEMARRLNQEAAKAVTYGGLSEEEALKLVTLNPAKMLHIDNRVGSIRVGKDADIVLWSTNPLSIYTIAEKTYVDGIPYWDLSHEEEKKKDLKSEESRLIGKMLEAKNNGSSTQKVGPSRRRLYQCETMEEDVK